MTTLQFTAKILIITGFTLALCGGVILLAARFEWWDKIPGNFLWKKGPVTVYFPLGLSIIASILLSLIFYFMGRK